MLNQIIIKGSLLKVTSYTDGNIRLSDVEWKEKNGFLCTTLFIENKNFIEVRFKQDIFEKFSNMKEAVCNVAVCRVAVIGRLETEISRGTGIVTHYILVEHVSIED